MPYTYSVVFSQDAFNTARTLVQILAGASGIAIERVSITQTNSTTSAQTSVQLLRKSAAATVTSFTPLKFNPGDPASLAVGGTSATGTNATAEGTDGDLLVREGFNHLNGYLWLPTPEGRIFVPQAGIFAVKFPNAPGSANWRCVVTYLEYR